jgi:hypothetical protein
MPSKKTPPSKPPARDGRTPLPRDMQARVEASFKRNEEALRRLAKL